MLHVVEYFSKSFKSALEKGISPVSSSL